MKFPHFEDERRGPTACSTAPDPDIFFPEPTDPKMYAKQQQAKKYCGTCPYQRDCLAWALAEDEPGMWGGTSRNERRKLRQTYPSDARILDLYTP